MLFGVGVQSAVTVIRATASSTLYSDRGVLTTSQAQEGLGNDTEDNQKRALSGFRPPPPATENFQKF